MKYRNFKRSGIEASELGYGCWPIGEGWGAADDKRDIESLSASIERSISHVPAGEGQQWKDAGYYLLAVLALILLLFFRRGGSVAIE